MNETKKLNRQYPVEISGWDNKEEFFVEKTRLQWTAQNQTRVELQSRVRSGSIVFLRLLDPVNPPANFPVAYRAAKIMAGGTRDCAEVQLEQIWPRSWDNAAMGCASQESPAGGVKPAQGTPPSGTRLLIH